jgi:hypothetical protein
VIGGLEGDTAGSIFIAMSRISRIILAGGFIGLAVAALGASPASAAGGGDPKIKAKGEYTVYENGYSTLEIQYRCATGHTAALYADIWQGGTRERPVSLYNSESTDFHAPDLICDGDKHTAGLGLILFGYTENNPTSPYEFFGDTARGFGRGNVTVILYDLTTGHRDTDFDTIDVISRDGP